MPRLANPWWLLLTLAVAPLAWLYIKRMKRGFPAALFTAVAALRLAMKRNGIAPKLRHLPAVLKGAALVLLAIALARPQSVSKGQDVHTEGIDIVIVLDISASMLAQDFHPDRVGAAKLVAADFIRQRPDDRIGVVLFAKQAFTQCPLTIDHNILLELLDGVQVGLSDPDNTAIGSALAAGLNRLKASQSKSRVMILLTDGENNYGLPPTTGAEAAQALGVRVYTIGIGSRGVAPYPGRDIFGRPAIQQMRVSIDEDLLTAIAEKTGGHYFRATDEDKLRAIFAEIDRMEKTKIEVRAYRRYGELFYPWAAAALALLTLGFTLQITILRGAV